ncbi:hypothetical protein [Nocardioides sp. SYSU D00065]|uniref:hypothetical protein n=1 Tax=Nocardioides sp. SYSU D00065 TaxID=2817378 RepID=UPI001B33E50A|nr:hypothetical protein [Nocardioides sp. SYSU D00065]
MTRARLAVAAPLVACLLATGCSDDPQAAYCQAVEEHQAELGEAAASQDTGAMFDVLDAYDHLSREAPRDITDDWDAVLDPLHALEDVLAEHGVDPSAYSASKPPAGVDDEARAAIESAAREVGSERTVTAMAALEQHALDVCGTPLSR